MRNEWEELSQQVIFIRILNTNIARVWKVFYLYTLTPTNPYPYSLIPIALLDSSSFNLS